MNDTLKKELEKCISDDFMNNAIMEDMTPIMSEVFAWGMRNITGINKGR